MLGVEGGTVFLVRGARSSAASWTVSEGKWHQCSAYKILSPDSTALSDGSALISFLPVCRVDRRGRGVEGTMDDSSNDSKTWSQCSTLVWFLERRLYPCVPVMLRKGN
jgi:hypothetical protein